MTLWSAKMPLAIVGGLAGLLGAIAVAAVLSRRRQRRAARPTPGLHESDAMSTLAGGIVHEIRNPLNALSVNLQLLREEIERGDCPVEERTALLDTMRDEVHRIDGILKDFLRLTRPPELRLKKRNPSPILESVLRFVEGECDRVGIRLRPELGCSEAVLIDEAQFKQAIFNLLLNAIEATPPGGEIRFRTRCGQRFLIEIEDTGAGIAPEDQPRVFDLFFSRRSGGTGLGLPIVQRIVHDHHGQIGFSSEMGRGTRFTISLPLA
jgi:signal transduction histidine kinase